MKIDIKNTEVRNQPHEMWIEGAEDFEPTEKQVIDFVKELGYKSDGIDISFDNMMGFWRWSCNISI